MPLNTELTKSISHINEMVIYDVGGSRTRRHEWMKYFEDGKQRFHLQTSEHQTDLYSKVDSLIFLAPLSAYDQCLVEDPTVNRVQDTLNLWESAYSLCFI